MRSGYNATIEVLPDPVATKFAFNVAAKSIDVYWRQGSQESCCTYFPDSFWATDDVLRMHFPAGTSIEIRLDHPTPRKECSKPERLTFTEPLTFTDYCERSKNARAAAEKRIAQPAAPHPCQCPVATLMSAGCQCGGT